MLTIVIPAHNEAGLISLAKEEITSTLQTHNIEHEFIFVDDGSSDTTWEEICDVAQSSTDAKVSGIRLSRQFGKEAAISAGLRACTGDCCVVMDCDLQHPVSAIPEMYRLWEQGFEVIEGVKSDRGDESAMYRGFSLLFYRLMSKLSHTDLQGASDFKLLDRKVIDAINTMPEHNRFFRALSHWTGFKSCDYPYEVQERRAGDSKWSTIGLAKYAITNITSFTTAPMQIVTFLGALTLVMAVLIGAEALIRYLAGNALSGFTTVILLILITSSLIMISLGFIGYYIARIYEEVKNRPDYFVTETTDSQPRSKNITQK